MNQWAKVLLCGACVTTGVASAADQQAKGAGSIEQMTGVVIENTSRNVLKKGDSVTPFNVIRTAEDSSAVIRYQACEITLKALEFVILPEKDAGFCPPAQPIADMQYTSFGAILFTAFLGSAVISSALDDKPASP